MGSVALPACKAPSTSALFLVQALQLLRWRWHSGAIGSSTRTINERLCAFAYPSLRLPEWNEQYLRFAEFEKLATDGSIPAEKFFALLTAELIRVEAFRKTKEASLQKTQQSIESLSPKYIKGKSRAAMAVLNYLCWRDTHFCFRSTLYNR